MGGPSIGKFGSICPYSIPAMSHSGSESGVPGNGMKTRTLLINSIPSSRTFLSTSSKVKPSIIILCNSIRKIHDFLCHTSLLGVYILVHSTIIIGFVCELTNSLLAEFVALSLLHDASE